MYSTNPPPGPESMPGRPTLVFPERVQQPQQPTAAATAAAAGDGDNRMEGVGAAVGGTDAPSSSASSSEGSVGHGGRKPGRDPAAIGGPTAALGPGAAAGSAAAAAGPTAALGPGAAAGTAAVDVTSMPSLPLGGRMSRRGSSLRLPPGRTYSDGNFAASGAFRCDSPSAYGYGVSATEGGNRRRTTALYIEDQGACKGDKYGSRKRRTGGVVRYICQRLQKLIGHVEPTPALTAAKTQRTPCGVNRFALLSIYFFYAFLTARVYFAWPSLSNLLFRSNAYAWLCDPASPDLRLAENGGRRYRCEAQNSQVGSLFVTCLTFAFSCSLLAGVLLDFFGPKITALIGQICNMLSWLLLAFAGEKAQTYFPAFIFMGIGSDIGYLPVLSSANLFPGHEGLVVACLGAAKSLSFAIPAILDQVELNVKNSTLQDVSLGYVAFGPGLCVLLSLLLIPLQAFAPWNEFVYLEDELLMTAPPRPLTRVNDSFASYEAHAWRESFSSFQDVKDWMHHHHLATPLEELTHSASLTALPPLRAACPERGGCGPLLTTSNSLFPFPPSSSAAAAAGGAGAAGAVAGGPAGAAGGGKGGERKGRRGDEEDDEEDDNNNVTNTNSSSTALGYGPDTTQDGGSTMKGERETRGISSGSGASDSSSGGGGGDEEEGENEGEEKAASMSTKKGTKGAQKGKGTKGRGKGGGKGGKGGKGEGGGRNSSQSQEQEEGEEGEQQQQHAAGAAAVIVAEGGMLKRRVVDPDTDTKSSSQHGSSSSGSSSGSSGTSSGTKKKKDGGNEEKDQLSSSFPLAAASASTDVFSSSSSSSRGGGIEGIGSHSTATDMQQAMAEEKQEKQKGKGKGQAGRGIEGEEGGEEGRAGAAARGGGGRVKQLLLQLQHPGAHSDNGEQSGEADKEGTSGRSSSSGGGRSGSRSNGTKDASFTTKGGESKEMKQGEGGGKGRGKGIAGGENDDESSSISKIGLRRQLSADTSAPSPATALAADDDEDNEEEEEADKARKEEEKKEEDREADVEEDVERMKKSATPRYVSSGMHGASKEDGEGGRGTATAGGGGEETVAAVTTASGETGGATAREEEDGNAGGDHERSNTTTTKDEDAPHPINPAATVPATHLFSRGEPDVDDMSPLSGPVDIYAAAYVSPRGQGTAGTAAARGGGGQYSSTGGGDKRPSRQPSLFAAPTTLHTKEEEEASTPSFRKQFFSSYAFGIILYSVLKALMYAFFTTGGENLLGKQVNDFMGAALPFSCIPCILLGKVVDLVGIMPVLLLLNSCITLAYGFAMIPSVGTAYLGALLYICYVSFYSSQSYCYVSDTFSSCHFGKLVGTIHMIAGLLSLLKIPMQSMVVNVFHSNYLYPCVIMLLFCCINFIVLIWLVILKRRNPHPFWPQSARDAAAAAEKGKGGKGGGKGVGGKGKGGKGVVKGEGKAAGGKGGAAAGKGKGGETGKGIKGLKGIGEGKGAKAPNEEGGKGEGGGRGEGGLQHHTEENENMRSSQDDRYTHEHTLATTATKSNSRDEQNRRMDSILQKFVEDADDDDDGRKENQRCQQELKAKHIPAAVEGGTGRGEGGGGGGGEKKVGGGEGGGKRFTRGRKEADEQKKSENGDAGKQQPAETVESAAAHAQQSQQQLQQREQQVVELQALA